MHFGFDDRMPRVRADPWIIQTLGGCARYGKCAMNSAVAFRTAPSPNKIIRSRQDFWIVRTNRSAWAFRWGLRGGNFTEATPESGSVCQNSVGNHGSRS